MTMARLILTAVALALLIAPLSAQRSWVEARSPNSTVLSDAGTGRGRDIAWQFEQIREAASRTFPWIRVATSRPVVVVAARDASTMRAFAPWLWDEGVDGRRFTTATMSSVDRTYVLVRADVRIDDVEGVSPYQAAYWAYAAQALGDTSRSFPRWLQRGVAEVSSNTLVREKRIQLGRVLPNKYIVGLLNGADATASLAGTLGGIARFDVPLDLYICPSAARPLIESALGRCSPPAATPGFPSRARR